MALTPENKVKALVCKLLDTYGVYYFKPPANGYGRQGIPDIVGCANGKFFAVECKAGKGTTTTLQDREIQKIIDAGGRVLVINETNLPSLTALMEELK